jgi:hypothetical protein
MKKLLAIITGTALALVSSGSALAYNKFVSEVEQACGYPAVTDCTDCHDASGDYKIDTYEKQLFLSDGACAFCPENDACLTGPATTADLYDQARNTITKGYFEDIFGQFMYHMSQSMQSGAPDPFADVFPDCPELAATIASDHSRLNGALVRRVTTKTRNQRNIPDEWELEQLLKFEEMAANGDPRNLMQITDPRGANSPFYNAATGEAFLPSNEFETYEVVSEEIGKGKNKVTQHYFRYIRSLTIPPMPSNLGGPATLPNGAPNPNLPCLKCHGTGTQVSDATRAAIQEFYPYDTAMGYSGGQIRGAWTVKIPIDEVPAE